MKNKLFGYLLQRLHQENEKLFERLTERNTAVSSPRVSATPKVLIKHLF
jgi:hypothetical protein